MRMAVVFTSAQMAANIKVSLRTLKRELAELQKQGIIQRIGSDKNGHWVFNFSLSLLNREYRIDGQYNVTTISHLIIWNKRHNLND